MKKRNFVSQRGYSLIEIMIILVITAILVTFVVARFGKAGTQFKRQNISRELKVNLERARFDAVKRRAAAGQRSEVKILSPTSFTVKTDLNQNGTVSDATDTRTIDFSGQTDVTIVGKTIVGGVAVGNNLVFPITIKFDQFGRIEAKNGATTPQDITPLFTVCSEGCTADNATTKNADVIYVSPSGTVAMLNGDEKNAPTFPPPSNITAVPVAENVNPEICLDNANTGC